MRRRGIVATAATAILAMGVLAPAAIADEEAVPDGTLISTEGTIEVPGLEGGTTEEGVTEDGNTEGGGLEDGNTEGGEVEDGNTGGVAAAQTFGLLGNGGSATPDSVTFTSLTFSPESAVNHCPVEVAQTTLLGTLEGLDPAESYSAVIALFDSNDSQVGSAETVSVTDGAFSWDTTVSEAGGYHATVTILQAVAPGAGDPIWVADGDANLEVTIKDCDEGPSGEQISAAFVPPLVGIGESGSAWSTLEGSIDGFDSETNYVDVYLYYIDEAGDPGWISVVDREDIDVVDGVFAESFEFGFGDDQLPPGEYEADIVLWGYDDEAGGWVEKETYTASLSVTTDEPPVPSGPQITSVAFVPDKIVVEKGKTTSATLKGATTGYDADIDSLDVSLYVWDEEDEDWGYMKTVEDVTVDATGGFALVFEDLKAGKYAVDVDLWEWNEENEDWDYMDWDEAFLTITEKAAIPPTPAPAPEPTPAKPAAATATSELAKTGAGMASALVLGIAALSGGVVLRRRVR